MGIMDKYNKGSVKFEIDINGFKFVTLENLFARDGGKTIFGIDGLYINKKSNFGDHPVAIVGIEGILVDLPSYMGEVVRAILSDPEAVEAINSGHVGFSVQMYEHKKYKKICYGVRWEDI